MDLNFYDVLIIGAGASGLIAAYELSLAGKKVAVVEARDRIGGRIHTISNDNFSVPVELGAEFIHGDLALTKLLLKKAGLNSKEVKGELWQKKGTDLTPQDDFIEDYDDLEKKFKELKNDLPVSAFIEEYLTGKKYEEVRYTLKNYVEGYYAADTSMASTYALCEELSTSDDEQYRVEGGYLQLAQFLADESTKRGASFYCSQEVQQINWSPNNIEIITPSRLFHSKKLLLTVPLGVIQQDIIRFVPQIKDKLQAAKQLGFGPVIKIVLELHEAFWKLPEYTGHPDLDALGFLFSREEVPTWWTQYPSDVCLLTGWLAGPRAEKLKNLSNEEILQKAFTSLQQIFSLNTDIIEKNIKAWQIYNWATDPFNLGGYAYEVVNGPELRKVLKEPVADTLFFAGEGLFDGPAIGTVEAALVSGREVAFNIIASS